MGKINAVFGAVLLGSIVFWVCHTVKIGPPEPVQNQASVSAVATVASAAKVTPAKVVPAPGVPAPITPTPAVPASWGKFVDPDGDCRYSANGDKITIEIPPTLHDLAAEYHQLNAPTILREVTGDFSIEVTVDGDLRVRGASTSSTYHGYHGAGLLIWLDEDTYVRLERANVNHGAGFPLRSSYSYVNFEQRLDGNKVLGIEKILLDQSGDHISESRTGKHGTFDGSNRPTSLRLKRRGNQVIASAVQEDEDVNFNGITVPMPAKVKVGVVAVNTAADKFACTFEAWKLTPLDEKP